MAMFLLVLGLGSAATRTSYVDQDYTGHQLRNISNLSITNRFTDSIIVIEGGTLWNATTINGTSIFQGSNLVLDTGDLVNFSANRTEFWDTFDAATDLLAVGTYGTTNFSGNLVNATVMWENGFEVATLNDLTAGNVTVTSIEFIKNVAGVTVEAGTAMRFVDYNSGLDRQDALRANNTNPDYHGDCLVLGTIANNANGQCVVSGKVTSVDTSDFTVEDSLYLNESPGTLTNVKPISANCIQKMGMVLRSHASQGVIWISGGDRCNDVPSNFSITGNMSANKLSLLDWSNITPVFGAEISDANSSLNVFMTAYIWAQGFFLSGDNVSSFILSNISLHNQSDKHGNTSTEIAAVKVNNATHADSASSYTETDPTVDQSKIEGFGFNITTDLKNYFDTLYAALVNLAALTDNVSIVRDYNTTWVHDQLSGSDNVTVSAGVISINKTFDGWDTDSSDDLTTGTGVGWANLTDYPTACTTYYSVTGIADATTCTYGNDIVNWSNVVYNITQPQGYYHCFNASCGAYIFKNASSLVIKVN